MLSRVLDEAARANRRSVDRAIARRERADATAEEKLKAQDLAKVKAKKAADKADAEELEERELREAQGLLAVAMMATVDAQFAPDQPATYINHAGQEKDTWQIVQRPDGTIETLTDSDGLLSSDPLHVHTFMRPDGSVTLVATDRRNGAANHFAQLDVPAATDEEIDHYQQGFVNLLNEHESSP